MAKASAQHKLDRVRPPRVHITYDVEIGDAIEIKELPFLLGVLGDFSGTPTQPAPRLRDRKFVEVNHGTFDAVLAAMNPHLAYSVENKLSDERDAGQIKVDLHFRSLEDFGPENVIRNVKPLRELLELRVKLADLLGTLQGNDRLNDILINVVSDADQLNRLRAEMGTQQPPAVDTEAEPAAADADAAVATEPVAAEPEAEAGPTESAGETEATATENETVGMEAEAVNPDTEPDTETKPVIGEMYGHSDEPGVEGETPEPKSGTAEPETGKEPERY